MKELINKIFNVSSSQNFDELALEVFQYQVNNCRIYKDYCDELHKNVANVQSITDIPFLPISFFKTHLVSSKKARYYEIFESSGTTGAVPSKHYIADLEVYYKSCKMNFERLYGSVKEKLFLALLPSYLERTTSSLVYMVRSFISESIHEESGFYLHNFNDLNNAIKTNQDKEIVLIGVSFALLDFIENYKIEHPRITIIETGGMKGRRKELIREELHAQLKNRSSAQQIHSEYGMTELLSQAYAKANGQFESAPWMKVLIRDLYDPFSYLEQGKTGGVNIIDLANIYSCSFIETQDVGRQHAGGLFEIQGRIDTSEIRGCNLMVM